MVVFHVSTFTLHLQAISIPGRFCVLRGKVTEIADACQTATMEKRDAKLGLLLFINQGIISYTTKLSIGILWKGISPHVSTHPITSPYVYACTTIRVRCPPYSVKVS